MQTTGLTAAVADSIRRVVTEYQTRETVESRCANDADKIECLLQAIEYRAAGNRQLEPWIDTMLDGVRIESGKVLALAAIKVPADAWWYDIVAAYGR